MKPFYKHISSPDYIASLEFDYIETYSFRRGKEYEENLLQLKYEYDKLKVRKEKQKNSDPEAIQRFEDLDGIFGSTQYLLDHEGKFHFSSILTNTFKQNDPTIVLVKDILFTPVQEIPRYLCAPEYRDAIVFYDKTGNLISTLNICLSCLYMQTRIFNHIDADFETYDSLKKFFINIGHEVEDPEYSILDNINKLKAKSAKPKP